MLWPPPRTAIGRPLLRAKPTAAITSAAPVHADDESRPAAVVRAVPDPARLGVGVIVRGHDPSPHGVPQLLKCCFPEYWGEGMAHVRLPFGSGGAVVLAGASLRRLSDR